MCIRDRINSAVSAGDDIVQTITRSFTYDDNGRLASITKEGPDFLRFFINGPGGPPPSSLSLRVGAEQVSPERLLDRNFFGTNFTGTAIETADLIYSESGIVEEIDYVARLVGDSTGGESLIANTGTFIYDSSGRLISADILGLDTFDSIQTSYSFLESGLLDSCTVVGGELTIQNSDPGTIAEGDFDEYSYSGYCGNLNRVASGTGTGSVIITVILVDEEGEEFETEVEVEETPITETITLLPVDSFFEQGSAILETSIEIDENISVALLEILSSDLDSEFFGQRVINNSVELIRVTSNFDELGELISEQTITHELFEVSTLNGFLN